MATTTGIQQGDVALTQTNDGGDLCVENGIAHMCPGLEVAAYLSMFGGNEYDDGTAGGTQQYWGNFIETEPSQIMRSRTQYLLRSLPVTAANLLRIQEAVEIDLAWMITDRIAGTITVSTSVPEVNKVKIDIVIEAFGEETQFTFTDNWKASVI